MELDQQGQLSCLQKGEERKIRIFCGRRRKNRKTNRELKMKNSQFSFQRIAFLIMLVAVPILASSQAPLQTILNNVEQVPVYVPMNVPAESSVNISCSFGKAELSFPDSFDINKVQITAIDLVYTDYPSKDDLKKLNGNRLSNLFSRYPQLRSQNNISWKLIRQMDGAEREPGITMFHGFTIYYRPKQDMTAMKTDLEKLKTMLEPLPAVSKPLKEHVFISVDTTHLRERFEIEPYTIVKKMKPGEALRYIGLDEKDPRNYRDLENVDMHVDSVYVYEIPSTDTTKYTTTLKPPEDTSVVAVLERKRWKNDLVVADVTASMYPYIGQLLF